MRDLFVTQEEFVTNQSMFRVLLLTASASASLASQAAVTCMHAIAEESK